MFSRIAYRTVRGLALTAGALWVGTLALGVVLTILTLATRHPSSPTHAVQTWTMLVGLFAASVTGLALAGWIVRELHVSENVNSIHDLLDYRVRRRTER